MLTPDRVLFIPYPGKSKYAVGVIEVKSTTDEPGV
jgi:hypothetical protein